MGHKSAYENNVNIRNRKSHSRRKQRDCSSLRRPCRCVCGEEPGTENGLVTSAIRCCCKLFSSCGTKGISWKLRWQVILRGKTKDTVVAPSEESVGQSHWKSRVEICSMKGITMDSKLVWDIRHNCFVWFFGALLILSKPTWPHNKSINSGIFLLETAVPNSVADYCDELERLNRIL